MKMNGKDYLRTCQDEQPNTERKNCAVSVIIPVYNAEKYLEECLDSILAQTMPDFEVICVDDGSADGSVSILESYQKKDARIHVIRQKNQGPGAARNTGLANAQGEYVFFMDADDFIEDTLLEETYGLALKEDADVVLFDGNEFNDEMQEVIEYHGILAPELVPEDKTVFSGEDFPDTLLQIASPWSWSKLFKRSLIEAHCCRFELLPNSEDLSFVYTMISCAQRIAMCREKLYYYRTGVPTSVEAKKDKAPACFIDAYLTLYRRLQEAGRLELLEKSWSQRFLSSFIHAASTMRDPHSMDIIYDRLLNEDCGDTGILKKNAGYFGNSRDARLFYAFLKDRARKEERACKVSVVIPVHNAENYLDQCLESLMNQTMQEFEVICVDDGSEDRSEKILRKYAAVDSRFKVYHQPCSGAAVARNAGMDIARGEYLYFMDADDFAADTLLVKAYNAAENAEADIVVFDGFTYNDLYCKYDQPNYWFRPQNAPEGKSVFSAQDCPEKIFQISNPAPWTKLFRKGYIREKNLRFENLQNSNDSSFGLLSMALAERITLVSERLYYYRVGITSTQSLKDKNPTCVIQAYMTIYNRLKQEGLYECFEKSFVAEFCAVVCFTLNTIKTQASCRKIFERLHERDVQESGVFSHEEDFYAGIWHYQFIKKFINCPFKLATKENRDSRIIVDHRAKKNPKVSVIMPIYNVEAYLEECLDSLTGQTLDNIEILCMDDGSSDFSLDILVRQAEKDTRIAVFSQKNSRQGAARNELMPYAKGEYVYFMDSDDRLDCNAFEKLTRIADQKQLDFVQFAGNSFYDTEEIAEKRNVEADNRQYKYSGYYEKRVVTGEELLTQMRENKEYTCSPVLKLIRREFLMENAITFPEGIIYEDNVFSLHVMLAAQRAYLVRDVYYQRRIREGSTMTRTVEVMDALSYFTVMMQEIRCTSLFEHLSPNTISAIEGILKDIFWNFNNVYFRLSAQERGWLKFFFSEEQRLLFASIQNYLRDPKAPNNTANAAVNAGVNKRLNDHDTALRYAQESLRVGQKRIDDHDEALHYAQESLRAGQKRMDDHDEALRWLQEEMQQIRNSKDWKIGRCILWLPRKIKRFCMHR